MGAFEEAVKVEEEGMRYLMPFFRSLSYRGQIVRIMKGELAQKLQQEVGDIMFNSQKDQGLLSVELKIENKNEYGNFFLETWSNKTREKPGWMCNGLSATWLGYFFIREQDLYMMRLADLRKWAFQTPSHRGHQCRIEDFPEKVQRTRKQMNDTWGRLVPIATLQQEIDMWRFHLNHNQLGFQW